MNPPAPPRRRAAWPGSSLRARLLLAAALWIGLALAGAGTAIHAVLRDGVEDAFDARLDAVALAIMAGVEADADSGAVTLEGSVPDPRFERVRSGWYWQVEEEDEEPEGGGGPVVLRSRSLWDGALRPRAAPALADGPAGEALRQHRRAFAPPGGGPRLVVRVAGPAAELDAALAGARRPLLVSLAVLAAALAAAAVLQVRVGLAPLGAVRRDLERVRRGRAPRLEPARHAEVAPLVAELNALLDHDAAVLERARRHVGDLAHALQTPLAVAANAAAEPGRDPDGVLADSLGRMRAQVAHHLRRARAAATSGVLGARVPVAAVAEDLATVLRAAHRGRALAIAVAAGDAPDFAGDRQDLEEMLGNLMDNACKWARGAVRVEARAAAPGRLALAVLDDGPGMPAADRARALARGGRLDELVPGHGLGLSITADLAALHGGTLALGAAVGGGLVATLDLPAA